jgi:hypothetical protein
MRWRAAIFCSCLTQVPTKETFSFPELAMVYARQKQFAVMQQCDCARGPEFPRRPTRTLGQELIQASSELDGDCGNRESCRHGLPCGGAHRASITVAVPQQLDRIAQKGRVARRHDRAAWPPSAGLGVSTWNIHATIGRSPAKPAPHATPVDGQCPAAAGVDVG